MKHHERNNKPNDFKFVVGKWNCVSDQSNANSDVGNEIIYNTEGLKSNLCDYKDAYILVSGDIAVIAAPATQLLFKIVHHVLNVSQNLIEKQ